MFLYQKLIDRTTLRLGFLIPVEYLINYNKNSQIIFLWSFSSQI